MDLQYFYYFVVGTPYFFFPDQNESSRNFARKGHATGKLGKQVDVTMIFDFSLEPNMTSKSLC